MNFKCLLEVLKEKEYISIRKTNSLDITMSLRIKTEYDSVRNKIIHSLPENCEFTMDRDVIIVMTLDDVEKWTEKAIQNKTRKRITLRRYFNRDEYLVFRNLIQKSNKYRYEEYAFSLTDDGKLIDIEKEAKEQEEERKKLKEIDDFIKSLP